MYILSCEPRSLICNYRLADGLEFYNSECACWYILLQILLYPWTLLFIRMISIYWGSSKCKFDWQNSVRAVECCSVRLPPFLSLCFFSRFPTSLEVLMHVYFHIKRKKKKNFQKNVWSKKWRSLGHIRIPRRSPIFQWVVAHLLPHWTSMVVQSTICDLKVTWTTSKVAPTIGLEPSFPCTDVSVLGLFGAE